MQLLSGVHRHEAVASAAVDCIDCAHHVHHSGHLTTSADHVDDCLLCQFLHLVYTVAATTVLVPLVILKPRLSYPPAGRHTWCNPHLTDNFSHYLLDY